MRWSTLLLASSLIVGCNNGTIDEPDDTSGTEGNSEESDAPIDPDGEDTELTEDTDPRRDSEPMVDQPPVVDAGVAQIVDEGVEVELLGAVLPDLDGLTLRWTQDLGDPVALDADDALSASFVAPPVASDTLLVFTLEALDSGVVVARDDTAVLVRTTNVAPVVEAGVDQQTDEGLPVILSGTANDADGVVLMTEWLQLSGPPVTLLGSDPLSPLFTAPPVGGEVTLLFRLLATDEDGAIGSDEVEITVSPVNAAPVVDAGVDQTVLEGATVGLFGSATDPDGFVAGTLWVQTSGEPVVIDDPTSLSTSFTAPATGVATTLTFRLEAVDDEGALGFDQVTMRVESTNTPPTVEAGPNQWAVEGETVTLSGSATDDGVVSSHRWVQVTGAPVLLVDPSAWSTTFTAPATSATAVLIFRLDVTDDDGAVGSDTVFVQVDALNTAPVVHAGVDQVVDEGSQVVLQGTASDADGEIASLSWTQLSGPSVALDDASVLSPTFTAPAVSVPTSLVWLLTATDDGGRASIDSVTVLVRPLNTLPIVDAGADRTVTAGSLVTLLGSAIDPDGSVARVGWTEIGTDLVSLSDASVLSPTFTAPDVGAPVALTFELEVEDDEGGVATDTVRLLVVPSTPVNQAPVVYAGPDRSVASGATIAMIGSATDADGSVVSTIWTQVGGPTVPLQDANTLTPRWVAPIVTCATVVSFDLTAVDDLGASTVDRVSLVVEGTTTQVPRSVPVRLDFEADDGGVAAEGSVWQWGVPTTGPSGGWEGSRVWATNLAGNYPDNNVSFACLPPIDLTGAVDPVLSFRAFVALTTGDAFIVEGLDPIAGWVPLIDALPVPTRIAAGRPSWSSTDPTRVWWLHTVQLPGWLGDTARLRLVLASDQTWNASGAYVDEIRVDEEASDPDQDGLTGVLGEWLTYGTDPFVSDVDGDGYDDGAEIAAGFDPESPAENPGATVLTAGFSLDFEADDGGLAATGGTWAHGAPASGPGRAHSGSRVWATVLNGNYADHQRSYLYLPQVDLTASTLPTLAARLWMAGTTGDGLSVEVWSEETASWTPVLAALPAYESVDAVSLSAWRTVRYLDQYQLVALPLDAYVGQVVRLRFAFRSDAAWVSSGAYLDDVAVFDELDDPDQDGVIGVLAEMWAGTDPFVADTDGDGSDDGAEVDAGTDPLDPSWYPSTAMLTVGTYLDFESGPGGLVSSSADWAHGVFASGPGVAWSGSQGWASNLSGNYGDNRREYVYLPPIDLTSVGVATLSFRLWMAGTTGDGVSIEAWHEGSGWATLMPDTPAYDAVDGLGRPAWRDQRPRQRYVFAATPLDAFAGETVRLRLALRTDAAWVASGAYLDDLAIDLESSDPDGDGLLGVLDELYAHGTDPYLADTDGDGFDDGVEVGAGTDPLNPAHHPDAVSLLPGDWLDFEQDAGGLAPDGTVWRVGNPGSGPGRAHSGSRVWATNLSGNYSDNLREPLLLPPVDLRSADAPTLSFRLWMAGTTGDGLGLDVQLPDGSWSRVLADAPRPYESTDASGVLAFRTVNQSGGYALVTFDLSSWAGQLVPMRLLLSTDGAWVSSGAYVDDLRLDEESDDPDGDGLIGVRDERVAYGTDPYLADTDGDGFDDGVEIGAGSDPLDPASRP